MGLPIIIIRPPTLSCPRCHTTLRRGTPRFGPARVVCANCGQLVETNLTPWSDLTSARKVSAVVSEIIAPSRWGKSCYVLLINFILCMVLVLMVSMCAFAFSGEQGLFGTAFWAVIALSMLVYLAVTARRLARLIKESNHYSLNREPPTWKAGVW